MNKAKEAAATTNKTTREIYADGLAGIQEEVVGQMPSSSAFSRNMRRQRKTNHPTAPTNLAELVLPEIFTLANENFVLYDNGQEATNRLIIFGTKQAMEFMATCPILHMDGTVSSGPALFEQIYVIHGSRDGWRVPLLFVLCTNKTAETYKTVFQKIKSDLPQYEPAQLNVDFELAAVNAIKEVFPGAKIQGCLFHLSQSVVRNLSANGLKSRYESDLTFSTEIRQMIALAFLPPDQVNTFFKFHLIAYKN